ncbi:TolC family protein [Alteromonas sp. AMM-1]|uniref:TolC family protein n=1 Tax=Alteromonas sp. AMM-1 TaxID=3394233 RepID=UPI0039A526C8
MKQSALLAATGGLLMSLLACPAMAEQPSSTSLNWLIDNAIRHDLTLQQSTQSEQSLTLQRDAVSSMPDPRFSLGVLNVPTDGFALNQEGMTQLRVGVSQMFPRGDSVALQRQQMATLASAEPLRRQNRELELQRDIQLTWTDWLVAAQSAEFIRAQQQVVAQLSDAIQNSYAASSGPSQYDVLSSDVLALALEDRLDASLTSQQTAVARLTLWLPATVHPQLTHLTPTDTDSQWLSAMQWYGQTDVPDSQRLLLLQQHPAVLLKNTQIDTQRLKQQQVAENLKPQWEVNAGYSYRQDDTANRSRADFISVGLSVDVPLFTKAHHQPAIAAMVQQTESIETEKRWLIQQQLSDIEQLTAQWDGLNRRYVRYRDSLIPLQQQQYDAALNAYTSANGDFLAVLQSHIALLDAQLKQLSIQGEMAKMGIKIAYYYSSRVPGMVPGMVPGTISGTATQE